MSICKTIGVSVVITLLVLGGCSDRSGSQVKEVAVETASKSQSPKTPLQRRLDRANAGDTAAQLHLGRMYAIGDGVPQDQAEGAKWYRLAAEQGNEVGQYNLGVMYGTGQGVTQDYVEAYIWYRLAAEQGFAPAQYNLGNWFDTGEGVPRDYDEAVKLFRLAAEQGLAHAQYSLARRVAMGQGVTQDFVEAYAWFSVAAAGGYRDASTPRDWVADKLTPDQLRQAQQQATELFDKFSSVK